MFYAILRSPVVKSGLEISGTLKFNGAGAHKSLSKVWFRQLHVMLSGATPSLALLEWDVTTALERMVSWQLVQAKRLQSAEGRRSDPVAWLRAHKNTVLHC